MCPKGHEEMKVIGQEVTREIAIIPAQVYVIEHVQYKYACETCEKEGIETKAKKSYPWKHGAFIINHTYH